MITGDASRHEFANLERKASSLSRIGCTDACEKLKTYCQNGRAYRYFSLTGAVTQAQLTTLRDYDEKAQKADAYENFKIENIGEDVMEGAIKRFIRVHQNDSEIDIDAVIDCLRAAEPDDGWGEWSFRKPRIGVLVCHGTAKADALREKYFKDVLIACGKKGLADDAEDYRGSKLDQLLRTAEKCGPWPVVYIRETITGFSPFVDMDITGVFAFSVVQARKDCELIGVIEADLLGKKVLALYKHMLEVEGKSKPAARAALEELKQVAAQGDCEEMRKQIRQMIPRVTGFNDKAAAEAKEIREKLVEMMDTASQEISQGTSPDQVRLLMNEYQTLTDQLQKVPKLEKAKLDKISAVWNKTGKARIKAVKEDGIDSSIKNVEQLYSRKRPIAATEWQKLGSAALGAKGASDLGATLLKKLNKAGVEIMADLGVLLNGEGRMVDVVITSTAVGNLSDLVCSVQDPAERLDDFPNETTKVVVDCFVMLARQTATKKLTADSAVEVGAQLQRLRKMTESKATEIAFRTRTACATCETFLDRAQTAYDDYVQESSNVIKTDLEDALQAIETDPMFLWKRNVKSADQWSAVAKCAGAVDLSRNPIQPRSRA